MNIFEKTLAQVNRPYTVVDKVRGAIQTLKGHYLTGMYLPCCMYSGGKDSSALSSMSLIAWVQACELMPHLRKVPFIMVSVDTKVEQPVKMDYLADEFDAFKAFAKEHGINLIIETPHPTVGNRWQGKVVGGVYRNFSTETSRDHKCAIIWKIDTATRCIRRYEGFASDLKMKLLQILGSRYDESETRKASLDKIGASASSVVPPQGAVKYDSVYPVYNFTKEDIWNYLLCSEKGFDVKFPAIQDGFDGTIGLYNDLGGGECSFDQQGSSCSGSRDGCWLCFASNKPMIDESLLVTNPHVAPLAEFRRFMLENDRNALLRNFIQTTLDKGKLFVKYNPNGLCGSYLLKILEIGLTIQEREKDRAAKIREAVEKGLHIPNGRKVLDYPTFEIFSPEDVIFIDLQWAMRGLQIEPHAALKVYDRIVNRGERVDIPDGYLLDGDFSTKLELQGKIYLGDVESTLNDAVDLQDEYSHSGGWVGDSTVCESILEPEIIKKWIDTPTGFMGSIDRILKSGAITVPNGQMKAIKKRLGIVEKLYASGLNEVAFVGGTLDLESA
ncbi:conserved hypothetical protein [Vibrio chagasii]|nr:conserved hypothetical protein [Vibrio chagasii]